MAIKRSLLIDSEAAGYYHLTSRCVRRTFLCGIDEETGKNYNHRKNWIERRIIELSSVFAIEVYAYAVMSNHYHLVVYVDPKAPLQWSDEEVAERWLSAYSGAVIDKPSQQKREVRRQLILDDPKLLHEYRKRLGSLSWLMARINEPLAKMSNREDCCKGHFWESRFTSQALLDEAAVLACMAYVDLNPIRAGLTDKLEQSEHTSIKARVEKITNKQLQQAVTAVSGDIQSQAMNIKLQEYIELVEWSGKVIIHPNKASIPQNLTPIFERLNIDRQQWLNQLPFLESNYCRMIGALSKLQYRAQALQLKWLKGITAARKLYLSP